MVLEKQKKCVGDCNGFVCFGRDVARVANKLVAIGDSQTALPSQGKKCIGNKME
jgi:hypothetical protein